MLLLFLDIDGVLNSGDWIRERDASLKRVEADIMAGGDGATEAKLLFYDTHLLDPKAVAVLNTILDASGACVVITSTWRVDRPLTAIVTALVRRGFEHPYAVIGTTPEIPDKRRGDEIQAWLSHVALDVEALVVLDDDFIPEFEDRQVRTDFNHGLTPDHAELILEMLGVG